MNNCSYIILGATGDLAKRKLIPALYALFIQDTQKPFAVIGASLEQVDVADILNAAKPFIEQPIDEQTWDSFVKKWYYVPLNFNHVQDFERLNTTIQSAEKKHTLSGNRLFYIAAAANFYCTITTNLFTSGVAQKLSAKDKPWHRLVYEKPFGHNLASAHEINACIEHYFFEDQIYRIDHYLTKDVVTNITLIRFTNCVFEPLWNNRYIDHVQIILSEKEGIDNRGAYYDNYGALCDVVQNHMLELMTLIAMEAPEKLVGDYIRDQRAKVLQKVQVVDAVLGQYEGYTHETSVDKNSKTDTFAALHLKINNPRWAGVPFYLKTGKALNKKETVVHIKFKQVECLLTKNCPSESNYLTIRVYPDESFTLMLNAKQPDSEILAPIAMEYSHSRTDRTLVPSAHQILLEEIIKGEQSVSVRFDEIESAWRIIDAVKNEKWQLHSYKKGSNGPQAVEEFAQKHGMRWRS